MMFRVLETGGCRRLMIGGLGERDVHMIMKIEKEKVESGRDGEEKFQNMKDDLIIIIEI